ncbi:MAG: hypothetical protein OEW62_02110 [Candidatus Bathyarchaeota archaeon]|nr:hypothetical protein [Candidatus Bathyarchaeota archaeon]MDH5746312.1 hypothetical protein [Candidatus Bathyarchaeota archaeon]
MRKSEAKKKLTEVVKRFSGITRKAIKEKLSEQDITTKFVLPMLETLNWNIYKITEQCSEVHEKAYREKPAVGKGLPDITLRSKNGTVFIEVKKPPLGKKGMANLERYEDADLIVLTSFEDLKVYTRYEKKKPKLRYESNYKTYVEKFDELWKILSNTKIGKSTRAAYKATR